MSLKTNYYLYTLTLSYFIISFIGILHHELWLDESHHWLIARDSNSFLELIQNTRYEGHPILWNILLYGITRFTLNPFWMQFLHILISATVVFIFLKKAPFNWIFKTLFIFGYFMLFEYNLISRNYILGILFLFLAVSIFKKREQNFTQICIYLALASNVHLMFLVISFGLFLIILFEQYQNKQLFKKQNILGYLFFGIGFIFILVQIQITNSIWLLSSFDNIPFHEKLIKGFISLFKGLITIPDFRTIHFWNSNYFINISKSISSILGLLAYFIPLLLFYKNKKTLYFVYITLIGIQIFFFITQRGATRFDGSTYIIIIIALWIEKYYVLENIKPTNFIYSLKLNLLKKPIIYSILMIQFFSGLYAYGMDIKYPFCSAKETVNYLKNENINTKNIITITCEGTLISPFLEKKVYFMCNNSLQSYCHWNLDCTAGLSQEKIIEMISNYLHNHSSATYVSTYPIMEHPQKCIWIKINDKIMVRFLKKFDKSIIQNADYYIYEVSKISY